MLSFVSSITFLNFLKFAATALLGFLSVTYLLFLYATFSMAENLHAGNEKVLIFAVHPDDGVIMAGGYAIQTMRTGGSVSVIFMTGSKKRINEAKKAWSLIGVTKEHLLPLKFDNNINLTLTDTDRKIEEIRKIVERTDPDTIIIPAYEGGHFDHDITNYLVSSAVKSMKVKRKVFEAPEYNYYFSMVKTPEKILDCLLKLIPWVVYHSPPSFIRGGKRYYLQMSRDEIKLKRDMLNQFKSQHPETLFTHFGFNDRFQILEEHDYHKPPHDYGNALIYNLRYGNIKLFRRLFSRPYWKPETIHTEKRRERLRALLPL